MKNLKIEISFEDIVSDMFQDSEGDEYGCSPSSTFKEAVQANVIGQVVKQVKELVSKDAVKIAGEKAHDVAENFIKYELESIIKAKLIGGEVKTRHGQTKSLDELIESKINQISIEEIIRKHIDVKANAFAVEMKSRYDNIFAAKVVSALNHQKMLSPEVAKILLGEE